MLSFKNKIIPALLITLYISLLSTKVNALTSNIPLINVNPGDTQLDSNNWTVVWGGKVSTGSNYFDTRMVGNNVGMIFRTQLYDSLPEANDKVEIKIHGVTITTFYKDGAAKGVSERCDVSGCRGWSISTSPTWTELGGKPNINDLWDLSITFSDLDSNATTNWNGKISWGLKNIYLGNTPLSSDKKLTINVAKDASIGGGTECGKIDEPTGFFSTWGNRNYGTSSYLVSQNQWDQADWPCFGKNAFEWNINTIPANSSIIKATLNLSHFGENGTDSCYATNASGDTVYEIFEIKNSFIENSISWDNAEIPYENLSRTLVTPARTECNNGTPPPFNRIFDVTEIVKRAILENRTSAELLMYTSAGQYHSGKQFYSKEGTVKPYIEIFYRPLGTITPTPTATLLPSPTVNLQYDVNKDGKVNLTDVFEVIKIIFQ